MRRGWVRRAHAVPMHDAGTGRADRATARRPLRASRRAESTRLLLRREAIVRRTSEVSLKQTWDLDAGGEGAGSRADRRGGASGAGLARGRRAALHVPLPRPLGQLRLAARMEGHVPARPAAVISGRGRGGAPSKIAQIERIRSDLRSVAGAVLDEKVSSRQGDTIIKALNAELRAIAELSKLQDLEDLKRRLDRLEEDWG